LSKTQTGSVLPPLGDARRQRPWTSTGIV